MHQTGKMQKFLSLALHLSFETAKRGNLVPFNPRMTTSVNCVPDKWKGYKATAH